MLRLALPIAAVIGFFLLSLATVRVFRPAQPRKFFLLFALLLLVATTAVYVRLWPLARMDDAIGLVACLFLQLLACLTMWNAFYSLLWGFSGSLMYDLANEPALRHHERLIRSYEGDGEMDRMMARRLPQLVKGGWITYGDRTLRLEPKGRLMAIGTALAFRIFSLGMGGGIKE